METLVLAQSGGGGGAFSTLFMLGVFAVIIGSFWRVFSKAGQPGWGALVPIFNLYCLTKIAGRPAWWILLCFLPLINIAVFAVLSIDIAKAFGKSAGFGIGLWLLGIVFYPILAFGSAEYVGPGGAGEPHSFGAGGQSMAA